MSGPKITVNGRSFDRFIHFPDEVTDGTCRCIRCGQIDEDDCHDERLCQALPRLALSIMQPWAWLAVNRHKEIENRNWSTKYRGPVAIHAGKKVDYDAVWDMSMGHHPANGTRLPHGHPIWLEGDAPWSAQRGGIVGVADVVDCVVESSSDWYVGTFGFVLANQRPVDFIPCKGALGFFDWRKQLESIDVKTS